MEQARIIVVDDFEPLRVVVVETLENARHRVVAEAAEGNGAVELIEALAPAGEVDVLLTDNSFSNGGGPRVVATFHAAFEKAVSISFSADPHGVAGATYNVPKPDIKGVLKIIADLPEPERTE